MFYKISAPHVSLREYMYEGNLITMPLVLLIGLVVKTLRIPLPGSTDIPPVESLQPFRSPPEKVDPEIYGAITRMDQELHDLGFTRVDLIAIHDVQHHTRYGGAVYQSPDGETVAWVRYRLWPNLERRNKFARLALYSLGPGGEIILTTSATRDLLDPPDWNVEYIPKLAPALLLDRHREHVRRVLGRARVMRADQPESAFALLEHTHEEFVQFQLERGVFAPLQSTSPNPIGNPATAAVGNAATEANAGSRPEAVADHALGPIERGGRDDATIEAGILVGEETEHPNATSTESPAGETLAADPFEPETDDLQPIVDEVRRQENKQSGWISKVLILGVSIAFFIGLGALQWELEVVLLLVPILLVHELGHYIAMKVFGYKNIHMFFIPLLGAAVSGRHYRVSGWKKAIVSLAGPLPSIVLGFALGVAGIMTNNEWLLKGSLITMILNVLNLAPFLPLDGGQVAHVTLFSRSNFIDLLFRVGTIIALLGVAAVLKAGFLFALGIAMVVGLPTVWRTLNLTDRLRKSGVPQPVDDSMPPEAIRMIASEIQRSDLPTQGTTALAKLILTIYESVIIRPPSWPATLGIWVMYFGGLLVGVIGMVAVTVASMGDGVFDVLPEFEERFERVTNEPTDLRLGELDAESEQLPTDLLVWRFSEPDRAAAAFETLKSTRNESVSRVGDLVFTSRVPLPNPIQAFQPDFGDDLEMQVAAMEGFANNDPRLNELPRAEWRRSFHQSYPQLIIAADPETAAALIEQCESLPHPIGRFAPIAPWTPDANRTPEQIDLQQRLTVLQGKTDATPWQTDEPPQTLPADENMSEEDFRERLEQSAERFKALQRQRLDWIKTQASSTTGTTQRLYQAYANFETATLDWRAGDRVADQNRRPPQLEDSLRPLLPELGFLHPEHPLLASGVTVQAYRLDPEIEDERFAEGFPLEHNGRVLVYLQIDPTHDAAAGFAVVHAWLKDRGIRDVVWAYSTLKATP